MLDDESNIILSSITLKTEADVDVSLIAWGDGEVGIQRYKRAKGIRKLNENFLLEMVPYLFDYFPYCVLCGDEDNLTVDHVVPFMHGGRNVLGNVTVLCRRCNASKNNTYPTLLEPDKAVVLMETAQEFGEWMTDLLKVILKAGR